MNKTELSAAVAAKTGMAKKDAERAANALLEAVVEAMQQGDKVALVGFGTFEVKDRPARQARNPRTGEAITIEATKAPVFKAGKGLKDSVQ